MGELKDKVKGMTNEAIGETKQQSGDADTRAEGEGQAMKGQFQQVKGAVKGALGDKV